MSDGTLQSMAKANLRVILRLLSRQYQLFKSEVFLSILYDRVGVVTSGGFRLESVAGLGGGFKYQLQQQAAR
jgi:hypothetical protein